MIHESGWAFPSMPLFPLYSAHPHGMHYCLDLHLVSDHIWYSKPCLRPALQCQGQYIWQRTMSKPWLSTATLHSWTGPRCPSGLWLLSHHCRESASKIQTQPPLLPDSKPRWNWKGVIRFGLETLFSLPLWKQLPTVDFVALGNLRWYFNLLKRLHAKPSRTNLLEGVSRGRSACVSKCTLLQWSQQASARHNFPATHSENLQRKAGEQVGIMSHSSLTSSWALNLAKSSPQRALSCFLLSPWIHFQDPVSLW